MRKTTNQTNVFVTYVNIIRTHVRMYVVATKSGRQAFICRACNKFRIGLELTTTHPHRQVVPTLTKVTPAGRPTLSRGTEGRRTRTPRNRDKNMALVARLCIKIADRAGKGLAKLRRTRRRLGPQGSPASGSALGRD